MLTGKTAIVTGAGRGIGRAIARRLSASGAAVAIVARSEHELEETHRAIVRGGGKCLPLRADVSNEADVDRVISETLDAFGRIDILVNNAGLAPMATLDALEPHVFDAMLAVNVRAVFLCCRAAWDALTESRGVIVNISSIAGDDPFPGFAAYGGTKAFVNTFSRALHQEGQKRGIRVYCVAPGAVDTRMLRGPFPDFPADQALDPEEVGAFVESLLHPAAQHVAGQVLTIRKS